MLLLLASTVIAMSFIILLIVTWLRIALSRLMLLLLAFKKSAFIAYTGI